MFWPCQRQIGISLPLTLLAYGYKPQTQELDYCRFRWSVSLWIYSQWWEDVYFRDDESV